MKTYLKAYALRDRTLPYNTWESHYYKEDFHHHMIPYWACHDRAIITEHYAMQTPGREIDGQDP